MESLTDHSPTTGPGPRDVDTRPVAAKNGGDDSETSSAVARTPSSMIRSFRARPLVLAVGLLGFYLAVSLLIDPRAHLLTDVGGKSAAVEAMVERGDWSPDLGYWFADADPEGRLYPFDKTRLTPNGQWVNTTSFPLIYLARPLWAIGGVRLALLLPMLGAVVAALAAGAIERRLRPGSDGAVATLLVGAAGPVAVYALDFWEHSIALGAMALGVVAVIDAVADRDDGATAWWPALLAGLAYGFAATMRQEALVYGLVAGLTLLVMLARTRGVVTATTRGVLMAGGAVAMLAAHTLLEVALTGRAFRNGRTTGRAGATVEFGDQLVASAATTIFPFNGDDPLSYIVGGLLLLSLGWLVHQVMVGNDPAMAVRLTVVLWATYGLMLVMLGPRFVPGMVPTTPAAVAGLVAGWHHKRWLPLALGAAPLPLVLLTAYPAGSIVQWAGRYQLLTGLVLAVVAVAVLIDVEPRLLLGIGVASIVVTGFGLAWSVVRTNSVADDFDTLLAATEPDDVVVWRDTVNARETGALMPGRRWLGAPFSEEQALLAELLMEEEVASFVWLDEADGKEESFLGFEAADDLGRLDFFELRMTRFVRTP